MRTAHRCEVRKWRPGEISPEYAQAEQSLGYTQAELEDLYYGGREFTITDSQGNQLRLTHSYDRSLNTLRLMVSREWNKNAEPDAKPWVAQYDRFKDGSVKLIFTPRGPHTFDPNDAHLNGIYPESDGQDTDQLWLPMGFSGTKSVNTWLERLISRAKNDGSTVDEVTTTIEDDVPEVES